MIPAGNPLGAVALAALSGSVAVASAVAASPVQAQSSEMGVWLAEIGAAASTMGSGPAPVAFLPLAMAPVGAPDRPADLVGRPLEEVVLELERAGLTHAVAEETHDEEVPAGHVVGTAGEVDAEPSIGWPEDVAAEVVFTFSAEGDAEHDDVDLEGDLVGDLSWVFGPSRREVAHV